MKYNKRIVFSSVLLMLISTGCVKPTEEVNSEKDSDTAVVYDEQPTATVLYDNPSTPIIYGDPTTTTATATTTSTSEIYSSGVNDGTIIATDHYQPAVGSTTTTTANGIYGAYGTPPPTGTYSSSSSTGVYGGGTYNNIDDPYTNSGSSNNSYSNSGSYSNSSSYGSYNRNNSYSSNTSYTTTSGGGIQLQVAALRDYYAAEEFKNNLSLDPKYKAYIKRGPINKVIITGFSSRAEAKALAARQFPGAFIVSGSSSNNSSYSTPSYSNSNYSYTTNTSYSSGSSHTDNTIGVQVGAFSSKAKAAQVAKEKAGGRYTAIVKKAKVRGRTVYKAIIVGFSSRQEAKNAIASGEFGDAFVVRVK